MLITLDTTVLVKALVEPRREKKGKNQLCIPSVAIVETASVVSRLTGSEELGKEAADFVTELAHSIIYDVELLDKAVAIATNTKASVFDVIFLACSKLTNSMLITDDAGMHKAAASAGVESKLLREMQ